MTQAAAVEVAREFWRRMATNDFHSVVAVLAPDFTLEWPQTGEASYLAVSHREEGDGSISTRAVGDCYIGDFLRFATNEVIALPSAVVPALWPTGDET